MSCHAHGEQDKLSSMGLVESVIGRNEVYQAMNIANQLIKEKHLPQILCGWQRKEFHKKNMYYFLTQPDGLPLKTIAEASKENNCIFISSSWRSICNETFRLLDEDSALRIHALVFVLLHEIGHLIGKENDSIMQAANIKLDSLFLKSQTEMKEELFADFFAADVVKNSHLEISRQLVQDIEELYSRVDYYLESRYDIHGGGLRIMLAEPAKRFGDLTYSHPNLNLRMHLISYIINPSSEKLHRLKWIQEQRKLFYNTDTFTPDIMDGLSHLKNLPNDDSSEMYH